MKLKNQFKAGDRVEWYDLVFKVCEGVLFDSCGFIKARMDDDCVVLIGDNLERIAPIGTLDRQLHARVEKALGL